MDDLANEFSWSCSRKKIWDQCRRKYYYRFYGGWDGWKADAPEDVKRIYRLTKSTTLDMFTGSQVHSYIAEMLGAVRSNLPIRPLEGRIRQHMKRCFAASERGLGPSRIFPLFLEDICGQGIPEHERERAIQKVVYCVQRFYDSRVFNFIRQSLDHITWLRLDGEGFDPFEAGGFWIHSYPDLAVEFAGQVRIYDWKTGSLPNQDPGQAAAQSLWAARKLEVSPIRIMPYVVAFGAGEKSQEVILTDEDLEWHEEMIIRDCFEMFEFHQSGLDRLQDDFPATGNREACGMCQFFDVCKLCKEN